MRWNIITVVDEAKRERLEPVEYVITRNIAYHEQDTVFAYYQPRVHVCLRTCRQTAVVRT